MPSLFKLSEIYKDNFYYFLDQVLYDISAQCGYASIILLQPNNLGDIKPYEGMSFEYRSQNPIIFEEYQVLDNVCDIDDFIQKYNVAGFDMGLNANKFFELQNNLNQFYEEAEENYELHNFYIHCTCEEYIDAIFENGYGYLADGIQLVGDKENSNSEMTAFKLPRKSKKKSKKSKKDKKRYKKSKKSKKSKKYKKSKKKSKK